ncbi:MAG: 2-oxoglutarate dehydrogenase E1 component [Chloroflexi bacterium]|nr:2-oxoglutarate dehydrogenase E1 component [Chloroflexota bacterium]
MTSSPAERLDEFFGPNAGYALELLERVQESAPPTTLPEPPDAPQPGLRASAEVSAAAAATALAQSIRLFGHRAAHLDPLGSEPPGDPHLDYRTHGLSAADLARLPASIVGGAVGRVNLANAAEAIQRLEQIYCGTAGYEVAHVEDPTERAWLLEAIEEERFRPPHDPVDERELLDRLTEISAFERFIHRAYPGQTRFSIEGLGMLIPMLDEMIADAAAHGTRSILLGMAHRGRLNVLAHVLGKPYARILAEFEGREPTGRGAPSESTDDGWAGDVKYHAGARRAIQSAELRNGTGPRTVTVVMAPNPSHLEFVDPVVQGMARAADEDRRRAGPPLQNEAASLGVLIHGDASFPGQGVVAETLNLSRLPGYRTGGTLHIIANNQLGFTTEPREGRSTLYASDLAKGFEVPIVHVNADDPIACLAAIRLATAYRVEFGKDFLIDLIGYRRWGHNEGDDPAFTQPRMYAAIDQKPTVRERFAGDLVNRGVVRQGDPEAFLKSGLDEFQRIRESVRRLQSSAAPARTGGQEGAGEGGVSATDQPSPQPSPRWRGGQSPAWDHLKALNTALLTFPKGFNVHPKLDRALQRRRVAFERPDAPVDWGHAETLAFATLVADGVPVRLTGQDAVRGTFSQRHLTFFDARNGSPFTPLAGVPDQRASFDVHNSPLSENATLGFEYGYSVQAPDTLVIWEGQYGDFINGAQVIVDEFVVAGQAKWGLSSGLVLLLPHAWEGQGPDHSSGRLERFLEQAADNNIRVANCTTAGQYYFLLRRQAASLGPAARPLIVMTPKSLLRHPLAASRANDLIDGHFEPLLDDATARTHRNRVKRIVLCSGHIWTAVHGDERRAAAEDVAIVRIEELYPFPSEALSELLDSYRHADEVVWLQEEPQNMGAWMFAERRLRPILGERQLGYIGRPETASPAEGWAEAHTAEQRRIISEVLERVPAHVR